MGVSSPGRPAHPLWGCYVTIGQVSSARLDAAGNAPDRRLCDGPHNFSHGLRLGALIDDLSPKPDALIHCVLTLILIILRPQNDAPEWKMINTKQNMLRFGVGLLAAATIGVPGCGGNNAENASGQMILSVGDAPIDTAQKVVVEFTGVEMISNSGNPVDINFTTPKSIDLLTTFNLPSWRPGSTPWPTRVRPYWTTRIRSTPVS